jgi:predicted AAA+ superfamily ATPase
MSRKRGPTWEPRREDYRRVLDEQNPWQLDGVVPDELAASIERPFATHFWKHLVADKPRRNHLVIGPRRVGKTTCLYQTLRHLLAHGTSRRRLWWLRLDHPLLMDVPLDILARTIVQTSGASSEKPAILFLDELTYSKDWDLWLKTFYDDRWPLRIAGSSSATAALKDRRVESGVGRWEEQYLSPYLFTEFLDLVGEGREVPVCPNLAATIEACLDTEIPLEGLANLRNRFMLAGGFPELLLLADEKSEHDQAALLRLQGILRSDAVERAIYKDIPQAYSVDNPMLLERVLYTLAGQMTGIVSPSRISKNLQFSQPTFDRYLSYLAQAFLVFTLPNYSGSETARQKRGRKLYFVDGAIRNAALQRGTAPLRDPAETGLLIENLVAGHLHALSQQSQARLYYWRDGDDEVDLVYDDPNAPLALEVSASPRHERYGLFRLTERFPRFEGRCFFVSPRVTPAPPRRNLDGVGDLPLDLLLLAIGAQAKQASASRLYTPSVEGS